MNRESLTPAPLPEGEGNLKHLESQTSFKEDNSRHNRGVSTKKAIKLFQGYLWHPKDLEFDPRLVIPRQLGEVHVLVDPVRPPMSFFEDGTPTESQQFYQVTVLIMSEQEPAQLKPITQQISQELNPILYATPRSVGWQLMEDLRLV